jgi:hypothetical protein
MTSLGTEGLYFRDGGELAGADDGDAFGEGFDFREHVRAKENGRAAGSGLAYERLEFVLEEGIKSRSRFIQDEQFRAVHEGLDNPDFSAVARR